ncbi:CLUMA_CG006898, isoform A, partial [Clunio marinus]
MNSKIILLGFLISFGSVLVADGFEIGREEKFSFINDVSLYSQRTSEQPLNYRISASIKIGSVWANQEDENLLRFVIYSPELHLEKSKDDSTQEDDISGTCQVRYVSKSSTKYMKHKSDCWNDFEIRERLEKPLGVSNRLTRVGVITVSADGHLESIHSTDHHKFSVNAYPNVGFVVGSLSFLKSDGEFNECNILKEKHFNETLKHLGDVEETTLLPTKPDLHETENMSLVKLVKENKKNLIKENVGKSISAQTLLQLVSNGRKTKTDDFIRILNARSTQEIRGQLMDLLGAVQTEESHEAFSKTFNLSSSEDFNDIERYLQSLAVGIRPEESVIRDLLVTLKVDEIESEKLKDTLVQTVSSMAQKFSQTPQQDYESHVVVDVKNFLMKSINKCSDNNCKVIYIRGLQNLQSPDTVDKLINMALNYPNQISVAAMKALRKFKTEYLSLEHQMKLKKIFFQRFKKFDSSARTLALDILLELKHDLNDLLELIAYLKSNDSAYEIKQYMVQKLRMKSENCPRFNEILKIVLSREPQINNWNVFGGLKGLSTALIRQFSQQPSFNGSLLSVQEIKGGVLKRGNFDLLMRTTDEEISLFSLGIFASGLSSFISSSGEEETDGDEEETATAGMELAIQGAQMRPLTFFTGQGELMGHVWSGTASQPTTAYQGTTILQDHQQIISLNNGAFIDFSALGAISIDLNGKFEISLWYKNANSEVVQSTGVALSTSLNVKSSMISTSINLEVDEEPQINLSSKVDFSSKTAICIQLSQQNSQVIQTIKQSIQIPKEKSSNVFKKHTIYRFKIPSYSHVINRK